MATQLKWHVEARHSCCIRCSNTLTFFVLFRKVLEIVLWDITSDRYLSLRAPPLQVVPSPENTTDHAVLPAYCIFCAASSWSLYYGYISLKIVGSYDEF